MRLIIILNIVLISSNLHAEITCKGEPIKQGRYLNKNPPKSWSQCYGQYTYLNGSIYKGSFFKGKLQGEGILKQSNGSYYEGTWFNGKPTGSGLVVTVEPIYYLSLIHI